MCSKLLLVYEYVLKFLKFVNFPGFYCGQEITRKKYFFINTTWGTGFSREKNDVSLDS